MKIEYSFDLKKESPEMVLDLPLTDINDMYLSIANRSLRNGTALYQQRHIIGSQYTSERKKELGQLNITIPEHFKQNFGIDNVFQSPNRYLVLGLGDVTANLFRPSFDVSQTPALFYLKDEPINQKEYYGFIIQQENKDTTVRLSTICFHNGVPLENNEKIGHLKWLFCSTPLVYQGQVVNNSEMAANTYDLRHLFGKTNHKIADDIYSTLQKSYADFLQALEHNKNKIRTEGVEIEWYHAGIGIKEDHLIVIHHIGNLKTLAEKFKDLGVDNAVLLDSGGSSVIWANWNSNGTISHHMNYRPNRGAIIIMEMKGIRAI